MTNDSASPASSILKPAESSWLDASVTLRAELKFDVRRKAGRFVAVIEDPIRSKFFQVGHDEYRFLSQLDGQRTIAQIIKRLNRNKDYPPFTQTLASTILQWANSSNLLLQGSAGTTQRLTQAKRAQQRQRLLGLLNPICFRIKLLNPSRWIRLILPYTRWIFSWWMLLLWLATTLFAVHTVADNWDRFSHASIGILAGGRWAWLLLCWIGLKIVHEIGHGVACQKYGGEVREAGILLLLFAPLAYVDVTSSWRFRRRRHRMIVSAAGMYIELWIAVIAAIVWSRCGPGLVADLCYNIILMAGITTILFNANPLMRFDGYYILADALGVVNLYSKGQQWVADGWRYLVFGLPMTRGICQPGETTIVAVFGMATLAWRVTLCISLLLVASTLLHGAGLILATVAFIFWVVVPTLRTVRRTSDLGRSYGVSFLRIGLSLSCVAGAAVAAIYLLRAPVNIRAPAIVQFQDERVLRAGADGFLREILVSNGERVEQGQLLARLNNPRLQLELQSLRSEAEQSTIHARVFQRQRELAQYQAELKKLSALENQIAEKSAQVAELEIRAPVDGMVFRRGLSNRVDSFVRQGDVVLSVAHPDHKEVLVSIEQSDIPSIQEQHDVPVRLAVPGVGTLAAALDQINPRASDQLIDPAMGANAGGPLSVRPVEKSATAQHSQMDFRLLQPRFTASLKLDPAQAQRLQSGQRGTVLFAARRQSLAYFLYLAARDWVDNTLKQATAAQQ